MAITNAQQYKQLLAKGGRIGLKGGADASTKSYTDSYDKQMGNTPGTTKSTARSVNIDSGGGVTTSDRSPDAPTTYIGGQEIPVIPENRDQREELERQAAKRKEEEKEKFVTTDNTPDYIPGYLKFLTGNNSVNRKYFYDKVVAAGKYPGLNYGMTAQQLEDEYEKYMDNRMAGKTDAMGNPIPGFSYNTEGELTGNFIDNGGGDNNYIPPVIPGDDTTDDDQTPGGGRDMGGLAPRFAGSIFDFTGLADGGRAGKMDGGMMEDTPTGGIMDLESGRQMYFLGKLVKKATRAVKKVAKSPLGKAALMYGLGSIGGSYGLTGKLFSKGMLNPMNMKAGLFGANSLMMNKLGMGEMAAKKGLFGKLGLTEGYGGLMPTLKGGITLGLGVPALMDLFGKKEEEDNGLDDYYKSQGIDIADIRLNPYKFMASRMAGSQFAADGGRIGYQEGGDAEPVAKKTMPLLDMDGMEKDYREDGGFVPIGRMERADDVPARLSKNEFVFTADAVRNAGEGDIDKGAEVMYNMMKNLESGGEVSEESQGLDGAREMFKTSQRLEEVL